MTMPTTGLASPADPPFLRILQVDDHLLVREGLRHVLRRLAPTVEIIEAGAAREALTVLRQSDIELDLILLDLAIPDARPFDLLQASRRLQPGVPTVVLSASEQRFEVERAMRLGAQGYVFKSSSSQSLLSAVRRVIRGEIVSPRVRECELEAVDLTGRAGALTVRQVDVLRMLSRGLSNKEIAENLDVAENTVKVHLANIYRALGVTCRTSALLKAFETGLLARTG